jgi:hypothetical protein
MTPCAIPSQQFSRLRRFVAITRAARRRDHDPVALSAAPLEIDVDAPAVAKQPAVESAPPSPPSRPSG